MRKLRIYVDTSVIGGYFDDDFSTDTHLLFDEILKGEYKLVISDLTEQELVNAPVKVKTLLKDLCLDFELIVVNQEIIELANGYLAEKVVGQTSADDCIHIASATITTAAEHLIVVRACARCTHAGRRVLLPTCGARL